LARKSGKAAMKAIARGRFSGSRLSISLTIANETSGHDSAARSRTETSEEMILLCSDSHCAGTPLRSDFASTAPKFRMF
jgi:hypothetical protein